MKKENVIVLFFSKRKYERDNVEKMSDDEKYKTAVSDKLYCKTMSIKEYTDLLNNCVPIDMYNYTYIVVLN
jgi:hypothetical protein